ncbi:MAG: hypothetical protein RML49_04745 [Verrucomicrobiae bacterium]|nr:hypothetical protein [Verrucomicrobiae bacterium]
MATPTVAVSPSDQALNKPTSPQQQSRVIFPEGIFHRTSIHGVQGIFFVLLATLFAILTVPYDVAPPGVLRPSALWMSLGLAAPILARIWLKPHALFDPVNVALIAPIFWILLDPIQGSYELFNISDNEPKMSFICILLYAMGIYTATFHKPWRLPQSVWRAANVKLSPRSIFIIGLIAFSIAILRFAIPSKFNPITMWNGLFANRWDAPWAPNPGTVQTIIDHFSYFGYLLPTLTVLLGRLHRWRHPSVYIMAALSVIITAFISQGGGRREVGVMIASAFVVWFLTANAPKLRHILVVAALSISLLWLLQTILEFRDQGVAQAFTEEADWKEQRREKFHVDDNFLRMCQIMQIFPQDHPHVGFQYVIWVLARPIPRILWPNKPLNPGFDLAKYWGQESVSYSCSFIAEVYMAFSFIGCVIGGWIVGRAAITLRTILQPSRPFGALIMFGIGLLALFTGMRSGIEFILMSYGILAWIGLVWFFTRKKHPTHPSPLSHPLHPSASTVRIPNPAFHALGPSPSAVPFARPPHPFTPPPSHSATHSPFVPPPPPRGIPHPPTPPPQSSLASQAPNIHPAA